MYIKRDIQNIIKSVDHQFKSLLLTGPRQVGKCTVLKKLAPKRNFVSLDSLLARQLAIQDPELFLERYLPPLLIDEVQYAPNLFPAIKHLLDQEETKGVFWLTGSQQFHLMKNISESLAGRVAILRLLGLSQRELKGWLGQAPFLPEPSYINQCRKTRSSVNIQEVFHHIWKGSFPALWQESDINWEIFYDSYFQTYIQRDIRSFTTITNEIDFFRFVQAVAVRTGQQLNLNSIAGDVGITQPTAKAWLSLLERAGLVYLLRPYFHNKLKRLVKSPKIYFTDTGLCAFLSRWNTAETLERGAMNGAFLETFAVTEILKSYRNFGKEPQMYYLRDSEGKEIDLILEENGKLYPIEIKKTSSPNSSMVNNFSILPENLVGPGALLCFVKEDIPLTKNVTCLPFSYL